MGILSVFKEVFASSSDNMSFYQLYSHLRKWNDNKSFPYQYELPRSITFTSEFYKKSIELYKATRSDKRERAISVFWADGDLILSSVIKGSNRSVTPRNNITVEYIPIPNKMYYKKRVILDGKKYSEKDMYYKNVPKTIEVKYLFNMHTHPPYEYNGRNYYSFFSLQDIRSLLSSGAVITGMIGDKIWLLVRTNQTPTVLPEINESEINVESLESRLHIAVYMGEFNSKLYRVKSLSS